MRHKCLILMRIKLFIKVKTVSTIQIRQQLFNLTFEVLQQEGSQKKRRGQKSLIINSNRIASRDKPIQNTLTRTTFQNDVDPPDLPVDVNQTQRIINMYHNLEKTKQFDEIYSMIEDVQIRQISKSTFIQKSPRNTKLIQPQPDYQIPKNPKTEKTEITEQLLSHFHIPLDQIRQRINTVGMLKEKNALIYNSQLCFIPVDKSSIFQVDDKKKARISIEMTDGSSYRGQWSGNEAHGLGKYVFKDESVYFGNVYLFQWICGKAYGEGVFTHSNGDKFKGEWKNNVIVGVGHFESKSGNTYTGSWKNDSQNGFGVESYKEGGKYEGFFFNNMKHGEGKMEFSNGQIYLGQFNQDQFQGVGTYIWPGIKTYQGDWKHSQMDGKGKLKFEDGSKYVGDYKKDKKDGFGIFSFANGSIYSGNWRNGKQHGEGEFKDQQGRIKQGTWTKGIFNQYTGFQLMEKKVDNIHL